MDRFIFMRVAVLSTLFLAVPCLAFFHLAVTSPRLEEGRVEDASGGVAGARVGMQGERERVLTGSRGHFRLPCTKQGRLVASKPGHRIASQPMSGSHRLFL